MSKVLNIIHLMAGIFFFSTTQVCMSCTIKYEIHVVAEKYILSLGKPSSKKKSILRQSFIKRWPPSPVGVLWKLIFLGYILGHLHCIVKKIEVWNPNDPLPPFVKLFRKIDFFKKDGFPYFGLILTFFSTPVLMAFWQCTWPDSSQEIQLPSDQSGVKLTWWMQERDHKRSMKKYVGHTVVNLERTYISYMKYI